MAMGITCSLFFLLFMGMMVGSTGLIMAGLEKSNNSAAAGNVGIVEIEGAIFSSKKTIEALKAFREDHDIKAIVVRIDSPGGSVGPSQEIYGEIMKTRKVKPVVASLGSVAASGGYYAASSCQGIMANAGTLTGSIGVIMEYANVKEIVEKIGLVPVVIKSGEFKDIGSPLREIKDGERELLQSLVDEIHMQFVQDAATARDMTIDAMAKLADGRIYTGASALNLNLIDRLGNLDDAISWAGEIAGIEGKIEAVYPAEDKAALIRKIVQTLLKNSDISSTISDYFRFVVK